MLFAVSGVLRLVEFALLFASGLLLWAQLRLPGFAVPGALGLHDYAMAVAVFFVVAAAAPLAATLGVAGSPPPLARRR